MNKSEKILEIVQFLVEVLEESDGEYWINRYSFKDAQKMCERMLFDFGGPFVVSNYISVVVYIYASEFSIFGFTPVGDPEGLYGWMYNEKSVRVSG